MLFAVYVVLLLYRTIICYQVSCSCSDWFPVTAVELTVTFVSVRLVVNALKTPLLTVKLFVALMFS